MANVTRLCKKDFLLVILFSKQEILVMVGILIGANRLFNNDLG
jgi:hypothetical protein